MKQKELLLYFPELHFVKSTDITKDLYQIYSSRGKVKSKLVNKCKVKIILIYYK